MRLVALAAALFLCCGPKLDPVPLPAPCTVNCQPERPDGCTRSTCAGLQRNCGQLPDGCGGTLECGACAAGLTCGGGGAANLCGAPACVAETSAAFCARLGKDCDEITFADNCGVPRQVNCGACTSPATCGGGKVANVCGNEHAGAGRGAGARRAAGQ